MGDVVSYRQYHPYGKTSARGGQQPTYGFAGAEIEEEEELGLMQFGARWYAPGIGRWVSADFLFLHKPQESIGAPLESGLYSYSSCTPINAIDAEGTDAVILHGGFVGSPSGVKGLGKKGREIMSPAAPNKIKENRPEIEKDSHVTNNGSKPR